MCLKNRIVLEDTLEEILWKLGDGHLGATTALVSFIKEGGDDYLMSLFSLDTYGIYGIHVWQLYADICERDFHTMYYLLRAVQLGFLDAREFAFDVKTNHHPKMTVDYEEGITKAMEYLIEKGSFESEYGN